MKYWFYLVIIGVAGCADGLGGATDAVDQADASDIHVPRFGLATEDKATGALSLWSDASPTSLSPLQGAQGAWMLKVVPVAFESWPVPVLADIKLLDSNGQRLWSNHVKDQLAAAGNIWRLPTVYLTLGGCHFDGQTFTLASRFDLGAGLSTTLTTQIRIQSGSNCH